MSGEQTRSQALKVPWCLDPVHPGIFHGLSMQVDRHLMAFNRIFWRLNTGIHDDLMGLCGLFFWNLLVIQCDVPVSSTVVGCENLSELNGGLKLGTSYINGGSSSNITGSCVCV